MYWILIAVAVAEIHAFRIPDIFGGQKPFSLSKDIEEPPSDRPFHDELARYITIPDEYYESLGEFSEDSSDEYLPSFTINAYCFDFSFVGSIVNASSFS